MKKINLAITGCMGRMGQQIIKSIKLDKRFKLVSLTENKLIYREELKTNHILIFFCLVICYLHR